MDFDPSFKFRLSDWCKVLVSPCPAPPESDVRVTVDPAYFSGPTNDESALCATFTASQDNINVITVLGAANGRWKGMTLADRIVDFANLHSAASIRIERNGNGAPDLLVDAIQMRAADQEIQLGRIVVFNPDNKMAAKRRRIFRLQSLLTSTPPALQICRGPFVADLFRQVENYCFDTSENHRREDGLLDVIALAAFGR